MIGGTIKLVIHCKMQERKIKKYHHWRYPSLYIYFYGYACTLSKAGTYKDRIWVIPTEHGLDGLSRFFEITKCLLNYKSWKNPSLLPQISIPTTVKSLFNELYHCPNVIWLQWILFMFKLTSVLFSVALSLYSQYQKPSLSSWNILKERLIHANVWQFQVMTADRS